MAAYVTHVSAPNEYPSGPTFSRLMIMSQWSSVCTVASSDLRARRPLMRMQRWNSSFTTRCCAMAARRCGRSGCDADGMGDGFFTSECCGACSV